MTNPLADSLPMNVSRMAAAALALGLLAGCRDATLPPAPDTTPPTLQLELPAAGDVVGPDSVVVRGSAADSTAVERVTYALGTGAEQPVTVTPGTKVDFRFTLKGLPAGETQLTVYAYDRAGNRAGLPVAFTTASATVRLTAPDPEVPLRTFAAYLHGEVASPVPVARLTYAVNGGAERPMCQSATRCLALAAGTERFAWEVDGLPQGAARITVFAYDAAGKKVGRGETALEVRVPARRYTVTYLGTLGGSDSHGADLNGKGQVVGHSTTAAGATHAFFWEAGKMTDIDLGLGTESRAVALNDSGQVVGTFTRECPYSFIRGPGVPEGYQVVGSCGVRAMDINNRGQVLVSWFEGYPTHTGIWQNGSFALLQNYRYYSQDPQGLFLNDAGRVLGSFLSSVSGPLVRRYAWLNTGSSPETIYPVHVTPRAVNDRGEVAYSCSEPGGERCDGFVGRGPHGFPQDAIPQVGRTHSNLPAGINNRTQVAGTYAWSRSHTGEEVRRPFLWESGNSYAVVPTDAAWEIDGVSAINDAGVILAHGKNRGTGASGAVLLTPAP
ncbi:MAG TPA: Ig-like domain-containing protein [Longimicrobiaceae bacterium]|nr:Ig-like domain-containing protein [Longimicrobiaceae bacterium]